MVALAAMQADHATAQSPPTRVILYIGDGVGASYWTAAAMASDTLAVKQFKIMGLVDTRASNSKVTDSAAGATAYAAGIRTYNGAIGVDPDGQPVTTVLEVAQQRGMAPGLIATSRITHATPASFAAHVRSRMMEQEIAKQIAGTGVDVILGGGRAMFDRATRTDSLDLLGPVRESHTYIETAEDLRALDTSDVRRLFGLFTPSHMPASPSRNPTLAEMTTKALDVLDHDPDGFFLMVEASQPDWRGHGNEPLAAVTAEMLDFDQAIGEGLAYQSRHPETLIVVVADHETGGLAIEEAGDSALLTAAAAQLDTARIRLAEVVSLLEETSLEALEQTFGDLAISASRLRRRAAERSGSSNLMARYTTDGHTGQMIPLFASGPGAERFGGMIDNWRVGELLLEVVRP
jgi:alkaline phosphatase